MTQASVTGSQHWPPLHVPAREIPVPRHVSAEAQAFLARPPEPAAPFPAPDDLDAWRKVVAQVDETMVPMLTRQTAGVPAEVEALTLEGVQVFEATPKGLAADDPALLLDIHGGGFVFGGGELCRIQAKVAAVRFGLKIWSVDYRMPPDHPYPAALDDCIAVYRAALQRRRPEQIVVHGGSAGGNIAAALALRARDEGLPLPACLILHSPNLDQTASGDSCHANWGVDTVLTRRGSNLLYAGKHDLRDPYLSPVFADLSKGYPPTLLASGTRDLLLSDTVRMHRALRAHDLPAELHIQEAEPHGGYFIAHSPESLELDREMRGFINRHLRRSAAA